MSGSDSIVSVGCLLGSKTWGNLFMKHIMTEFCYFDNIILGI